MNMSNKTRHPINCPGTAISSAATLKTSSCVPKPSSAMIQRFVTKLKTTPRACLMQLSQRSKLCTSVEKLIHILTSANTVAIKLSPMEPAIEHVTKLENLLSYALSWLRKFHPPRNNINVHKMLDRVKQLLTVSIQIATPLIDALQDSLNDSEDESYCESDSSGNESVNNADEGSDESSKESNVETNKDDTVPATPILDQTSTLSNVSTPCAHRRRLMISQVLTQARQEAAVKEKSLLNSTLNQQSFKRNTSAGKKQVRASLLKYSLISSTANKFSSMLTNDLVKVMKPKKKVTFSDFIAVVPTSDDKLSSVCHQTEFLKPIIKAPSSSPQPDLTEELIKSFNSSFGEDKHQFAKTMSQLTEQLSRTTISDLVTCPPEKLQSSLHKQLKDGKVTFILYASRLSPVLEKKSTVKPLMVANSSTGQMEPTIVVCPINKSKLGPMLSKETVFDSAQAFAEKTNSRVMLEAKKYQPKYTHHFTSVQTESTGTSMQQQVQEYSVTAHTLVESNFIQQLGRKRSNCDYNEVLSNRKAARLLD